MIKATTINQSVSWWACAKNIFAPNLFWLLHLKPNPKPLSFECRLKGSFIWRNKESAEKCNLTNDTKGTWLRAPNQDAQIHLKKKSLQRRKITRHLFSLAAMTKLYSDTKCAVQNFLWLSSVISQHASLGLLLDPDLMFQLKVNP